MKSGAVRVGRRCQKHDKVRVLPVLPMPSTLVLPCGPRIRGLEGEEEGAEAITKMYLHVDQVPVSRVPSTGETPG